MIAFRRTFSGVVACALVMIPILIAGWLHEIGGIRGMMDDASYPVSMLGVPLMAAVVSGMAFWIVIYPWARVARWISNRKGLGLADGCAIAVYVPALFGFLAGLVTKGPISGMVAGSCFGLAALVFWRRVAVRETRW